MLDPKAYLSDRRTRIAARLAHVLDSKRRAAAESAAEASDMYRRLYDYTAAGKMIRGGLAILSHEMFSATADPAAGGAASTPPAAQAPLASPADAALDLAVALELFQSGLLIHDDIMDGDDTRRGMPTLHRAYETAFAGDLERAGLAPVGKPDLVGQALAICAGDASYFIAVELLTSATAQSAALCARELVDVCFAQMRDVRWGASPELPEPDAVLEMYRYKTARYTFSMPLAAGALLAGRPEAVPALNAFGEGVGIAFQIRDDALGLYGDEREIGKPVGSDIREGKKTLYHILLRQRATPEENVRLSALYGNPKVSPDDVDYVRTLIARYGIDADVEALADAQLRKAREALEALSRISSPPSAENLSLLNAFGRYATTRAR